MKNYIDALRMKMYEEGCDCRRFCNYYDVELKLLLFWFKDIAENDEDLQKT